MNTPHVKTTHAPGEIYDNVWSDFEWVRTHRAELMQQYGTCVILVYREQVVGVGKTEKEAEEDAESRLPSDFSEVITPITYYLAQRHPFLRVHPTSVKEE